MFVGGRARFLAEQRHLDLMAIDALMESLEERYELLAFLRGALEPQRGLPAHRRRAARPEPRGAQHGRGQLRRAAAQPGHRVARSGPPAWTTGSRWRRCAARPRSCPRTSRGCTTDGGARARSTTASRSSRSGAGPCAATRARPCGCSRRSRPAPTGPRSTRSASARGPTRSSSPLLDEADLFTGLSFAEAHWVAAVLASAADRVEDAESLLFDLRVPVDLAWREVELASEVVEPGGPALGPAGALGARREASTARAATPSPPTRSTAATRPSSCCARTPTPRRSGWRTGAVDHLVARDARSLTRLLHGAVNLEEAHGIIEAAQANLAHHPDDDEHDEDDDRDRAARRLTRGRPAHPLRAVRRRTTG